MPIMKTAMSTILVALLTTVSQAATYNFIGPGNLNNAASWQNTADLTTGTMPGAGDIGTVAIDAAFPGTSAHNTFAAEGTVIYGGTALAPITITAGLDYVASRPEDNIFNYATLNASDDIFTGAASGNFTFNAGSAGNANDDFEANGGGTITINGGTHTAGDRFGAQNNSSTLSILGGTISAGTFRVDSAGFMNVGGDAVLSGAGGTSLLEGAIDIASDWTGSWTITDLSGTDWETEVTGGHWTLGGTTVDATIFGESFEVTNGGTTLSVIPEPATLGLVAMFGGGVLVIRRRFMI